MADNKTIQELENETINFWKQNNIFEKSVEQRSKENLFVFYDGPPFISGLPHYGHLLGSIAKDVIPRYWTMKGKRVERVWGWDAHGLTVENKVQAKLKIKSRKDIEKYGLEKFVTECYKYTTEISGEWEWYIEKIGRWVDMKNAYKTIDQTYMESVMWAFKQMYDKGLVYEGVRTSLFCPTCGTPVSNFEIAMDNTYKEHEDPAITVKFRITSPEFYDYYLLAWTTTPWTIPSNRALVLDEKEPYELVSYEGTNYICAQKRYAEVFEGKPTARVEKTILGKELLNQTYAPPYTFFASNENDFKVYSFEGMVNMTEGTGLVHSAPGFGEIDTQMGQKTGLTLMMTIDDEGKFKPGDNGDNPFVGIYYSKANPLITEDLEKNVLLFKNEKIVHRIPYHDRCDTLLIQKAQSSWFINVQKLKQDLVKNNETINWVPDHLKEGRFKIGIEQAPDWCISRSRFWATPMPVWRSEDGDLIVIGSKKELEDLSGQVVKDFHRPYIDAVQIKKNDKTYSRIPDVLDSWFEAGSMPFAQIHYPFENEQKFDQNFPGDYIVEYIAQVRAWFYVMHVISTAIFKTNSFKNVISTGVMSGSDGRKMSKTYGNYTDPRDVLEKIGGDALRLYLMSSPLMLGENANFDDNELKTKLRNIVNPLWNSAKFFLMYSAQYNWKPSQSIDSQNVLDIWIKARLNQFIKQFSENIEKYLVPQSVELIDGFVDDLSRWFVRRSRDRISSGDNAALSTLYKVLMDFSKATAPVIPFITEQIHLNLKEESDLESVHLCDYPGYQDLNTVEHKIIENMVLTRELVTLGHAIRTEHQWAVRNPKSKAVINKTLEQNYLEILAEELNVKKIDIAEKPVENLNYVSKSSSSGISIAIDGTDTPELLAEGLKREFIREIQMQRKNANLSTGSVATVYYPQKYADIANIYGDEIKTKVYADQLLLGDVDAIYIKTAE